MEVLSCDMGFNALTSILADTTHLLLGWTRKISTFGCMEWVKVYTKVEKSETWEQTEEEGIKLLRESDMLEWI